MHDLSSSKNSVSLTKSPLGSFTPYFHCSNWNAGLAQNAEQDIYKTKNINSRSKVSSHWIDETDMVKNRKDTNKMPLACWVGMVQYTMAIWTQVSNYIWVTHLIFHVARLLSQIVPFPLLLPAFCSNEEHPPLSPPLSCLSNHYTQIERGWATQSNDMLGNCKTSFLQSRTTCTGSFVTSR